MTKPLDWHQDELDNGLRIVTVPAPHLHQAMVAVYVRAGSRHETRDTNGVTHFLEHIVFRGCERFPDGRRMNARVEDAGGSLNAVTARDHGCYFTPIHPTRLEVAVDTLGAMLTAPLYRDVAIEREVILEEMLDEVDESGRDIDIENLSKRRLFGDHPLGLKIAGTPSTVRSMTEDGLRAHHAALYGARNMVLAVSGPISPVDVRAYAQAAFAALSPGAQATDTPPGPWPSGPALELVDHDESQTELRLSFPAMPEDAPDFPALMVLRRILDDGLSTRLQTQIVDRRGLAYSVGCGIDAFSDTGIFDFDLACAPKKVPEAFDVLIDTIAELTRGHVPEEEIERARIRHRMGLEFSLDSASDLAGWFGGTALFRPPESFEMRATKVDAVTTEDVLRVARATFRKSFLQTTAVGVFDKTTRRKLEKLVQSVALSD